jgi:hypothetical protein
MDKKIYAISSALVLLSCCSVDEPIYEEPVVISSPPPSLYPTTTRRAIIVKKRALPHNREEYHARLNSGQEINFTVDYAAHYQVGDEITLPLE